MKSLFQHLRDGVSHWISDRKIASYLRDDTEQNRLVMIESLLRNALNSDDELGSDLELITNICDRLAVLDEVMGVQAMTDPVGMVFHLAQSNKSDTLTLEVTKHTVSAITHPTVSVPLEPLSFNTAVFGDVIKKAIGAEIGDSIISRLINQIPVNKKKFNVKHDDGPDAILSVINQAANHIAVTTRRGCGNVVIVTPAVLSALRDSQWFVNSEESYHSCATLIHAGNIVINEVTQYKVFVSLDITDKIIVGYRGASKSSIDVGFTYSPYLLVCGSRVTMNVETYEPTCDLMTHDATWQAEIPYYAEIVVD